MEHWHGFRFDGEELSSMQYGDNIIVRYDGFALVLSLAVEE